MATKTELEVDFSEFHALAQQAAALLKAGDVFSALLHATRSLQYIDGMMQYEKRYRKSDLVNQPTLKIILAYAPAIFEYSAIDEVESFLARTKRVQRNSDIDWKGKVAESRRLLQSAFELWNLIEQKQDFKNVKKAHRTFLLDAWDRFGVIISLSIKTCSYAFVSSMQNRFRCKCWECGLICDATKQDLLTELDCLGCKSRTHFVILEQAFRRAE